jgi:hypothetical protein
MENGRRSAVDAEVNADRNGSVSGRAAKCNRPAAVATRSAAPGRSIPISSRPPPRRRTTPASNLGMERAVKNSSYYSLSLTGNLPDCADKPTYLDMQCLPAKLRATSGPDIPGKRMLFKTRELGSTVPISRAHASTSSALAAVTVMSELGCLLARGSPVQFRWGDGLANRTIATTSSIDAFCVV